MAENTTSSEERIMTIPLKASCRSVSTNMKAKRAVYTIKSHLSRHMKVEEGKIRISQDVNSAVWSRGVQKPPSRVKVKIITDSDGILRVMLPNEKIEEKKPEKKKEATTIAEKVAEKKAEISASKQESQEKTEIAAEKPAEMTEKPAAEKPTAEKKPIEKKTEKPKAKPKTSAKKK